MSSILKILTDVECQVYCDYELKGDVAPNTLFRIDMRKGTYLLEFKKDNVVLLSKEYEMCSNDEEQLLRVSLSEIAMKQSREIQYSHIAAIDVEICRDMNGGWYLENNDTKEKAYLAYNIPEYCGFDKCGLLYVNVGGMAYWDYDDGVIGNVYQPDTHYYAFKGGQWGCVNKQGKVQIPVIYDKPVYFYGPNVAVAESNGQIIFINKWNEAVFENIWDKVVDGSPFSFGKCIVEKNGNQGVIDERGCEVLPLIYSKVTRGQRGQFAVQINDKWGLVSDECSMIYPITFDIISNFYWPTGDFIVYKVKKCGKEGLLGSNGRLIFPIVFDEIKNTIDYILVKQNGLYGLYQREKQILPIEFDEIKHELTFANSKYDHGLFLVSKNHLWGVFDSSGNVVVPIKYGKIEYLHGGICNESFVIEKDGKWGYMSIDGNIIISPLYDSITVHEWHLKSLIVQLGERYGLISTKGEQLLPIEYLSISIEPIRGYSSYDGVMFVMGENGLGIFAEDGSCIIKPEYKEISAGCGGFIVTDKICKKGLFDQQGNSITEVLYDDMGCISGFIATKLDNVWQLWTYSKENGLKSICWEFDGEDCVSPTWYIPTPVQFKSYKEGHSNQLIIEENRAACDCGNYAVIGFKNDECKYIIRNCHDIQKTIGDCYVFDRYGKKGLYNKEGDLLYGNVYDEIEVKDELIYTIQNGCYLIYDYDGNIIEDKGYEYVPAFYRMYESSLRPLAGYSYPEGTYDAQIVMQNGKYGCLNKNVPVELNNKGGLQNIQLIIPCEYDYIAKDDYSLIQFNELSHLQSYEEVRYFVKKEPSGDFHYYYYHLKDEDTILVDEGIRPHPGSYYLFIDTETTGLLPTKHYEKYEEYLMDAPYLVQVALLLYDKDFNKLTERNIILAPQGYVIPDESVRIHGITNSYAIENGEDRYEVMKYLKRVYDTVDVIVGHNLSFDLEVIDNELIREHFSAYSNGKNEDGSYSIRFYKAETLIDTMKLGAEVCKIPSTIKGEKYKWPTLDELYRKLFGKSFQGQHNAINDVKATYECYCKMIGKNY